ncbi:Cytochrome b6-f complex iron-sulfur subunit [compost metagenome]
MAIFPHTDVTRVRAGEPCRLETPGGTVTAEHVVYATHHPLDNNLLVSKVATYQTYVIALKVPTGSFSQALAWDTEDPYHYWRQAPQGAYDLVLIGGEDHRTGQEPEPARRFERLEAYARIALGDRAFEPMYRWSGQILDPADGLPFIGRNGSAKNEFVATGFAGNGMTFGTYAGMRLTDLILEREVPAANIFNPDRFGLKAGAVTFLSENLAYPTHLVERLKPEPQPDLAALSPGEGQVFEQDGQKVAVARDATGALHARSAVCTHLGCVVHWNRVEASWDCPCHGSRFAVSGEVLDGPARHALAPVSLKVTEERG